MQYPRLGTAFAEVCVFNFAGRLSFMKRLFIFALIVGSFSPAFADSLYFAYAQSGQTNKQSVEDVMIRSDLSRDQCQNMLKIINPDEEQREYAILDVANSIIERGMIKEQCSSNLQNYGQGYFCRPINSAYCSEN